MAPSVECNENYITRTARVLRLAGADFRPYEFVTMHVKFVLPAVVKENAKKAKTI